MQVVPERARAEEMMVHPQRRDHRGSRRVGDTARVRASVEKGRQDRTEWLIEPPILLDGPMIVVHEAETKTRQKGHHPENGHQTSKDRHISRDEPFRHVPQVLHEPARNRRGLQDCLTPFAQGATHSPCVSR